MKIQFHYESPIYLQLAEYIRNSILTGALDEGELIPSVRQISAQQELNPNTVLNALQVLVQEGLLEKRRGMGMVVRNGSREKEYKAASEKFKREAVPEFIRRAKLLNLTDEEIIVIIKAKLEETS